MAATVEQMESLVGAILKLAEGSDIDEPGEVVAAMMIATSKYLLAHGGVEGTTAGALFQHVYDRTEEHVSEGQTEDN